MKAYIVYGRCSFGRDDRNQRCETKEWNVGESFNSDVAWNLKTKLNNFLQAWHSKEICPQVFALDPKIGYYWKYWEEDGNIYYETEEIDVIE